jgi:hypothetical protein
VTGDNAPLSEEDVAYLLAARHKPSWRGGWRPNAMRRTITRSLRSRHPVRRPQWACRSP